MGLFSPEQCRDLPVPLSRFTGERVTTKLYGSGVSPVEVRDADSLKLADKTAQDTVRWKGKCVFKLRYKPELRHQGKQSPRLPEGKTKFFGGGKTDRIPPRTGVTTAPNAPGPAVTAFSRPPTPSATVPPRPPRSRPVSSRGGETAEADACLSRLRSLVYHGPEMQAELVRLFNSPDPLTGQSRTSDYWLKLPRYWIRMLHTPRSCAFHPEDCATALDVERVSTDQLWADRYTYFTTSTDESRIDTGFQDLWSDMIEADGSVTKCEEPRADLGHTWTGYCLFVPLERAPNLEVQEMIRETAYKAKPLKVPKEPTEAERRVHELTHLPFRDWCPHCVQAKGRHGPSLKQVDRQPVIQVDYCYVSTHKSLPLRTVLTATDVQTGFGMAVVVPDKQTAKKGGAYAMAELKKFVFETGRTFGILQYDKENPLKDLVLSTVKELGGMSTRAAPTAHKQAMGSVGQMQRTLYAQLRTVLLQLQESTGVEVTSDHALFPWAVKHAQFLLNRYLEHADGHTSYWRRWQRDYNSGLCCFGEVVQAKLTGPHAARKAFPSWVTGMWLGRDTEADEVIIGTEHGVTKVRTVRRLQPSLQWQKEIVQMFRALPWDPKGEGKDAITEFVLPQNLTATGRVKEPPGLAREPMDDVLETQPQTASEEREAEVEPLSSPTGSKRSAEEGGAEPKSKLARPDPEADAEPLGKAQRIAAITEAYQHDWSWVASATSATEVRNKDGSSVSVEVNCDEEEAVAEAKLANPIIWDATEEFPEEAQATGMNKEMGSMKDFEVYTEVPVENCSSEQVKGAIGVKWVKRWKSDIELRMHLVVQGCFQDSRQLDLDSLFASTPSLVTLRVLLILALARNWTITLADVSTAFLHAAMTDEVFVWPPAEYYPDRKVLWRLNKAMYGLRQAPKLWQDHFAATMQKLKFKRCKSDGNLYCHESGSLFVLAYVDDLLIIGDDKLKRQFLEELQKELIVKITGELVEGTEHTFLGRRLHHCGDSIDVCMSPSYVDKLLEMYNLSKCNPVATTGSSSLRQLMPEPLDKEGHEKYRTAVGKLLWYAFVRPDVAYAVKELSRDVTAPTTESVGKLKHLLRYLSGTKLSVLKLRPTHQLSGATVPVDVNAYVDSDWAGCNKTRKSTSGSTVNVLGCNVQSTARTQSTIALSSGEAELYAIGQGTSEALFVRALLLESGLTRQVNVHVYTDSTAGKSMATRFGAGKRTKHVELRFLYMQDLVKAGLIKVLKVGTLNNPADFLTKYVSVETLSSLKGRLGVHSNLF